jgi:hypothetical protein
MTVNHIDEILAICDRVFGPDDKSPVPTHADMYDQPRPSCGPLPLPPYMRPDYRRPSGNGGATTVRNLTFDAALALAQRGGGRLCNNTRVDVTDDGFAVYLHRTAILRYAARIDSAVLDSGGYRTVTTKQRLNALLKQHGYRIHARKFDWYISMGDGIDETRSFEDGMTVALS